jgi:hypothetical protein
MTTDVLMQHSIVQATISRELIEVKKPLNPNIQGRSTSTESNATCATTLSSSEIMDWTITSQNEAPDRTDRSSDGDEELERLGIFNDPKMELVPEESSVPVNDTNQRSSSVQFENEPTIHEFKPERNDHGVPTSVQIHRALSPVSPSKRMRKSVGGTLRRQVTFHQVEIRRYPMVAGDNPACQMGAPVQLDWGFEELPALDLDDFEATRSQTRRRKLHHLILNYFQRNRILAGVGYTEDEIRQAEKEVDKERFRRDITKMVCPFWKLEDCVQSLRRKIKRKMNKGEKEKKEELERTIQRLREQDAARL